MAVLQRFPRLLNADSALVRTVSPSPNFGDRRGRSIDALILHYTGMPTGALARDRLLDPSSEVSCHYLVWEDGRIEQLVAETDRAWHAGRSFWAGETDLNSVSIGIEIVNQGHDGGCPPYPQVQIDAVAALARDVCGRHNIVKSRVLAHSDIAPDRKLDPGEHFPWRDLAVVGIGLWIEAGPGAAATLPLTPGTRGPDVVAFQRLMSAFGYDCPATGVYDGGTTAAVRAVQRHYRPRLVDGVCDGETLEILKSLRRHALPA